MCANQAISNQRIRFYVSFFSVALYVIPPIHVDYVKYIQFRLNKKKNKRTKIKKNTWPIRNAQRC